jgi:hypothetical protein
MATEKKASAFLEITMKVSENDRSAAAGVYTKYRQPFLDTITGAVSKQLLVREDDVQVLHGFVSVAEAEGYLKSDLFSFLFYPCRFPFIIYFSVSLLLIPLG